MTAEAPGATREPVTPQPSAPETGAAPIEPLDANAQESDTPGTRDIELAVEIAAPVDAVWRAITEGELVANWFAPVASAQPGEGGHLTVSWGAGAEWTSWITKWDPGRHLRLVDQLPEKAGETAAVMALDYRLTDPGGATRLDLVNSGLSSAPDWDDTFHMMQNGWRFFLWNLKHFLERHPGATRTMISERPWVAGSREEVWDRVFGANGLVDTIADGAYPATGDRFRCVLDGLEPLEGTAVLCDRPWAFAGVMSSLNYGVLHVEMEGTGERWKLGVWLSAYGVGEEHCAEIGAALARTVSRVFPEDG
ncbi:MAG: SRPBCC domain-containing protein [Gemmatimonadota bacterium]|nr:SRPBCC domain-containing protein [Gemmatimonadota bacterium]